MNADRITSDRPHPRVRPPLGGFPFLPLVVGTFALIFLAAPPSARAQTQTQTTVDTLAGGPLSPGGPSAGYQDGDALQVSQFDQPNGVVFAAAGRVLVADTNNGAIRELNLAENRVRTIINGLNAPVDVAVDRNGNIYVAEQGAGRILKFDGFFALDSVLATGLNTVTALALDSSGNIYAAESGGSVWRVTPGGNRSLIVTIGGPIRGLELLNNGQLVVTSGNAIVRIDPLTGANSILAGSAQAGLRNGSGAQARFNGPRHLEEAPSGALVVADRLNHLVRLVQTNGVTATLYGVPQAQWISDFPGWEDGDGDSAESRQPTGVAVDLDGTVVVSETFYHLLRGVTGAGLDVVPGDGGGTDNGGGGGTQVVVTPPVISPGSGYFPDGQTITVTSPNPDVFFTTDGSDPTTNSTRVPIEANVGRIVWRESLRDLRSLRVRAFIGTNSSAVVRGQPAAQNLIGVPRDLTAGPGSTVVVPVVLNLRTNVTLKSIQFRVEVTPVAANNNMISDQFRPLSVLSNDFVQVTAPSAPDSVARFSSSSYPINSTLTRGLIVSALGIDSNFEAEDFAVAAQLALPIPPSATVGQAFRIQVLFPSATADGREDAVPLAAGPARTITVGGVPYLVGDTAPGGWYNAGDFGDGQLDNSDVNNAFSASLGVRQPFPFSDVFDAMDVFPEDGPGIAGGDGEIRFLDWQLLLFRSLRRTTNNYARVWDGGVRTALPAALPGQPNLPGDRQSRPPGMVWFRHAALQAGILDHALDSYVVNVPVWLNVAPGESVSGLLLRAAVTPGNEGTPALTDQATFVGADGLPAGTRHEVPINQVAVGWNLGAFEPALEGRTLLGHIRFRVPPEAERGSCYSVEFSHADGSPPPVIHDDDRIELTQYEFETIRGCVWVGAPAPAAGGVLSDQWLRHFFADADDGGIADPDADPDGDNAPNWAEFEAGTHPRLKESALRLLRFREAGSRLGLRWLTAPGKRYVVESSENPGGVDWAPVADAVAGSGEWREFVTDPPAGQSRFYRIRVVPLN